MRHPQMRSNVDLASFLVTKNAWKGSYRRILSIGSLGITTYRKDNLRVTNQWLFQEIYNVRPDNGVKSGPTQQRFVLATGGSSGRKEMVFVSEFRNEILTHILRFRHLFSEKPSPRKRVSGVKLGWAEGEKPVFLEIGVISVDQVDQSSGRPVACYTYKDIEAIAKVSGLNGGIAIIHGGHGRIHLFRCSEVDNFVNALVEAAMHYMGISIHVRPDPLTLESCRHQRFGGLATPEAMISQAEFVVQKVAPYRYGPDAQPVTRTLCLTESLLVERDPISYRAICVQPLCEVFSLIRYRREPHQFSIEYLHGKVHTYFSSDRDSLVCSILDGVRASGNDGVCVRSSNSRRGYRVLPMSVPSSEEVESMHLRFLRQPPEGIPFWETVERFNANVAYSGLVHAVTQDGVFAENKEKLIKDALTVLLTRCPGVAVNDNFRELDAGLTDQEILLQKLESRFQAIRRLFASKAGFQSFTQLPGIRENLGRAVVSALALQDDGLTHAVVDAVNALMQPMHASPDLRQEQLNKTSIMSSSVFMAQLVNVFTLHALRGTGSLVITALLDFFTFAICQPYSETSEGESFETLLALVASRGRALFRLFCHPSLAIIKGAGLVMRALIEEAPDVIVAELRQMSLAEGALLQHLSTACFSNCSRDPRGLVLRQLSRILVTLWTENNLPAQDLLRRIFPDGLLSYLDSPDAPPREEKDHLYIRDNLQLAQEHMLRVQSKKSETLYVLQEKLDGLLQHWRTKIGLQAKPPSAPLLEEKPVALRLTRKTRLKLGTNDTTVNGMPQTPPKQLNWAMFYYQFNEDHAKPDLIWNLRTRDELRDALEKEVGEFHRECDYFSFSRLEEPAFGDSSETFDATNLMTEEQPSSGSAQSPDQGVDVAAECSSPDDSADPTTSSITAVGKRKKSNGNSTMDRLEQEVELLIKQANMVSWNHSEFRVRYASLSTEPQVANYFLRLLLEEDKRVSSANQQATGGASKEAAEPLGLLRIKNSREFFSELFRRYLQYAAAGSAVLSRNYSNNPAAAKSLRMSSRRQEKRNHRLNMRCLCLHAMAIVYGRCHAEIGPVSDVPLLVHLLDRTVSAAERDCLLMLLEKLVLNKYNANEFLEADGVRVVTDLAGLAHLHTSRAPPPTETNILMGGDDPDSQEGGGVTQREWWYWQTSNVSGGSSNGSSTGPLSFSELRKLLEQGELPPTVYVFAQGLDSQPRCRIDGAFGESDDEDELTALNSSGGRAAAAFAAEQHSQQQLRAKPSASTLGWMPANRVMQLRWSIPLLLGEEAAAAAPAPATVKENGIRAEADDDSKATAGVGDGEKLIQKLGYSSGALLDHTAMSIRCVEILQRLCEGTSSKDASGGIIRPLPHPRRAISHPNVLPHIVQLLLTFDPPVVERVASLLLHVIDQNPCLPRIYLTGVFYFILMYTGSNVLPIAKLLKATHLLQACLTEETTRQLSDLQTRSILGNILPEAMIAFLENHSPEKFAEIYLGDFDTPEAIWSKEMRRHMIQRLAAHLADFSPRLKSNTRAIYQYIGIPTINYPQLEGELFCNSYYLRHFCDVKRFPDWPVKDPIAFLRDVLGAWRIETDKKPCKLSYHDALRELELDPANIKEETEEAVIRRAYYQLSMKYHPDKNPQGQTRFHAINSAYQYLCNRSRISDGPNRSHLHLLIRSQSIIYGRYRQLLVPHKYAGYPMLISTIRLESENTDLFGSKKQGGVSVDLLSAATELAYETVSTSSLNAEELRREGGIQALQEAFARCSSLLSRDDSMNNELAVNVCCHVTAFFTVSTKFPASRECIHEIPQIVRDIVRLLYFKNLPRLCCQAAACSAAFCDDYWLCVNVYENGGLFLLLYHVLAYDFTLDESGVEADESTNSQLMLNQLSLLCLWALSRLAHQHEGSSTGPLSSAEGGSVELALNRLVTPHITRKLLALADFPQPVPTATLGPLLSEGGFLDPSTESGQALRRLAKLLTTNSATPCLIWDNQCRAELTGLVGEQVTKIVKTGEFDRDALNSFTHKTFAGELLIGEIFVRLYNKQATFPLDHPKSFAIDLLRFLKKDLPLLPIPSDGRPATKRRVSHIDSALEALRNVIRSYSGVELQCVGHFDILFSILDMEGYDDLKLRVLDVLRSTATNTECLKDIHASKLLVGAIMLFRSLPQAHLPLIEFLNHVIVVNDLLKEVVYTGGLVYLLEVIATSEARDVRQAAVGFLSRCLANPQVGRRIQALLSQFLPAIFPETIRDSPEAFLPLFESDHQNPELIWNQNCRDQLTDAVTDMSRKFGAQQAKNRSLRWTLPDAFSVSYATAMSTSLLSQGLLKETDLVSLESTGGLVVVAGVYLHLYVNQPGWMLRQPDVFLDSLMSKLLESFGKLPATAPLLRLLTRAAIQLLADRPGLLDSLPRKGYPHRLFDLFPTVNEPEGARTCLLLLHRMSVSKLCVLSMIERDTIAGFLQVTRCCVGEELGTLGETMFNIFNTPGCDPLVAQALKHDLIDYLLQTLHSGLPVTVRQPGQCRAYIVKALKAMQKSNLYGEKVTARLEDDPNWAEFRDQSHALFLTNAPQSMASAYLTAGAGGSSVHSGFLTTGGVGHASPLGSGSSSSTPAYATGPGGVPTAPPPPH